MSLPASLALTNIPDGSSIVASDHRNNYASIQTTVNSLIGLLQGTVSVVNVKDAAYGAKGDGTTDDYAAILAAYGAIPSTGGILYFPPGKYRFNTPLALTTTVAKPLAIIGSGPLASVLAPGFAAGDAITLTGDGASRFAVESLSVNPIGTRNQGTFNLKIVNGTRVLVSNITMDSSNGGLFMFDTCTFLMMNNCQGDSTNAVSSADVALRIKGCTGTVSDCMFRVGSGVTGYTNCKPCLYVTGTSTALGFSNCTFAGAGPRSQFAVTGVVSDASKFTVTTSATHDFRVGDFVVLRGMTPAAYNSQWRVATVPTGTTFTVTSTLNPGASSVNGTAESVACAALVSNEDTGSALSANEARFEGCIFEATQTGLYGSAGLYFDGRRGNLTQQGSLSGWNLTGNYYDQYATGLLLSGMAGNAANEPTVNGVSVAGGVCNARGRAIHLDQVQAVTISDVVGCVPGSVTPIDDGVSFSAGLYVYAGPAAPFTQGINVSNCQFGMGRNWQAINNTPYSRGIILDSPGINDLVVTGCHVFGSSTAVGGPNGANVATQRWRFKANSLGTGTFPPTATTAIPQIASANAFSIINGFDVQTITGTTNIQTINGGYVGREVTFLFQGALSLITGGNLAITSNYAVLAGQLVALVFDGTSWYVK